MKILHTSILLFILVLTMTTFNTLDNAINAYQSDDNLDKFIFLENKSNSYLLATYEYVYDRIKNDNIRHKQIVQDDMVKLYINFYKEKKNIIKNTIKLINEKLNINNPKIIILTTDSTTIRKSGCIIYPEVVFDSITNLQYFIANLNSYCLPDDNIIDPRKYTIDILPLMRSELFLHKLINYSDDDDNKIWNDSCLQLIPDECYLITQHVPSKTSMMNKLDIKLQSIMDDNHIAFFECDHIKSYLDLIDHSRIDDYHTWTNIGLAIYGSNPSALNLWLNWSKLGKYYDEDYSIYKWNSFTNNKFTIGTILYYARLDSPELYDELSNTIDEQLFETIKIHTRFLPHNVNDPYYEEVNNLISKWKSDEKIKSIAIKSAYGTGKTVLLREIIKNSNFDKILWITHRQTLANDVFGCFNDIGFVSYLDDNGNKKILSSNRLICQIESLKKIPCDNVIVYNELIKYHPIYDLVILDEIESLLFHFSSATVEQPRAIFNLFFAIANNSKKVIALDGDFNNRSYEFLKALGKKYFSPIMYNHLNDSLIIVENTYKYEDIDMLFTDNSDYFYSHIIKEVEQNKNIAICSMSMRHAKEYHARLTAKGIKCLLHTSQTDDTLKKKLRNVNKLWSQYQVVIFSPCIESGVNFSVRNYFYRVYGILSDKSTVQRGFMQMTYRVRYPIDKKYLIYTNGLQFKQPEHIKLNVDNAINLELDNDNLFVGEIPQMNGCYNFKEIKHYLSEIKNHYFQYIDQSPTMEMTLYDRIHIYNQLEIKNAIRRYHIPILVKMLIDKGINVKFIKSFENVKIECETNTINMKTIILNTPDINDAEMRNINLDIIANEATEDQKLKYERKMLIEIFNLKTLNMKFLDSFYNRDYVLINLIGLIDDSNIRRIKDEKGVVYKEAQLKKNNSFVRKCIATFGYQHIFDDNQITQENFNNGMLHIIDDIVKKEKHCIFPSLNLSKNIFLETFNRRNTITGKRKCFMGWFNSILKSYGLKITSLKKWTTVNKKSKAFYKYKLEILNNITDFIMFDEINNVDNLFVERSNKWIDIM